LPEIRFDDNWEMKARAAVAPAALTFSLNGRIEILFQCT